MTDKKDMLTDDFLKKNLTVFGENGIMIPHGSIFGKKAKNVRQMEFKMERTGLLKEGDVLPVTESKLPNSWYYTLGKAYAMSANYSLRERLKSTEGKVIEVKETPKGYYVIVEFDE